MSGLQLQNFALGIVARRPQQGSALLFVFWAPFTAPRRHRRRRRLCSFLATVDLGDYPSMT